MGRWMLEGLDLRVGITWCGREEMGKGGKRRREGGGRGGNGERG